jgi:TorA maturation chaperone TorD
MQSAIETERVRAFALLARLLATPPDAALLCGLAGLAPAPGEFGAALGALGAAAAQAEPAAVRDEYFALFIGVGRGEVLPYASYYLTGFLHERPLAALRAMLAAHGIARAPGEADPEDHIAFCCEVMAGMLDGRFAGDAQAFFAEHLRPWAARCLTDIEAAPAARFYRAVGRFGRVLFEIETAAAALPA